MTQMISISFSRPVNPLRIVIRDFVFPKYLERTSINVALAFLSTGGAVTLTRYLFSPAFLTAFLCEFGFTRTLIFTDHRSNRSFAATTLDFALFTGRGNTSISLS